MKVLLHICCAPCATTPIERLREQGNEVIGYFYNPNIHPEQEYKKRLEQMEKLAKKIDLIYFEGNYEKNEWLKQCSKFKDEPEGGKRCELCYKMRLEKTASYAKNNFDAFTTTLTISPHKNSELINRIGKEIGERYNIKFLEMDFKKTDSSGKDGFKRSIVLSKKYNLYRQNYCGCIYSIKT